MPNEFGKVKPPIRGWLILLAIILWVTPPVIILVLINEMLLPVPRIPWFEMLFIIGTGILDIISLVLFLRRKRTFVHCFTALLLWAILSDMLSFLTHFTSTYNCLYSMIGNIALLIYVLKSERVSDTFTMQLRLNNRRDNDANPRWFHCLSTLLHPIILGLKVIWGAFTKRILLSVFIILLVCIGLVIFRVYPRHISLSIKGVEYKLGSPQQAVKPVIFQLNGTLHTSLSGKQRTFDGIVNILGSTVPNKDNGKSLKIVFNQRIGGEILYFNWKTMQFYEYGMIYANRNFNEFTIAVFKLKEGRDLGWYGGNGLMISAPAQTRTQALQISNTLMKARLLPGHPLK